MGHVHPVDPIPKNLLNLERLLPGSAHYPRNSGAYSAGVSSWDIIESDLLLAASARLVIYISRPRRAAEPAQTRPRDTEHIDGFVQLRSSHKNKFLPVLEQSRIILLDPAG